MAKIPDESPEDFLVWRKFGRTEWDDIYGTGLARSAPHKDIKAREQFNESVAQYREELAAKPPEELEEIYREEYDKWAAEQNEKAQREEDQRFFNLPSAMPKYDHWTKCSHWTIEEAIALSLGRDPSAVKWEYLKPITHSSAFARKYEQRRDLATRAVVWSQLFDPVLPTLFLAWAAKYEIEVPPELIAGVKKFGGLIANWKDLYDKQTELVRTKESTIQQLQDALDTANRSVCELQAQIDPLQHEPPHKEESNVSRARAAEAVEGKERSLVAALVFGMAVAKYRHDPDAARSPTASMIASDLERLGIQITDETVRKWLNEAKEKVDLKRTE
ncbi:hypothetical protein [Peristeroidobacter agariperforans]|uniref:hypothetical protein n=1 Tax=Peristeroidobacter agariperforans TaxID=268404 RepID=UPI00101B96F1|nr:hypothetical protein [Peristeroidobacter agariperforans]